MSSPENPFVAEQHPVVQLAHQVRQGDLDLSQALEEASRPEIITTVDEEMLGALNDHVTRLALEDPQLAYILACLNDTIAPRVADSRLQAHCALQMGTQALDTGQVDLALQSYERALELSQRGRDPLGEVNTLQGLGDVERCRGQCDRALETYRQTLERYRKLGDRLGEGRALWAIGQVQLQQGQWDPALENLEQARGHFQAVGDRRREVRALQGIGQVQLIRLTHQVEQGNEGLLKEEMRPMNLSNPVLVLAERALRRQLLPERMTQEIVSLSRQGIGGQDLTGALQAVMTPTCPTPLVEAVALICVQIASMAGEDELAGQIHWNIANVLDERNDRLSLSLAVQHYQQARKRFAPDGPDYGGAQMNEGVARQELAGLGIEPIENLQRAVALYEGAAEQFEEGSLDWSKARRNQAYALMMLGKTEEAYQRIKEALEAVEDVRAQMRREEERIAFLETMAGGYATMVEACLDLAGSAPSSEQAESWRWEAWHWVQRGKSRALLELLANARPCLTEEDRPLWEELEQRSRALDEREREIRQLVRLLGGESESPRAPLGKLQPVTSTRLAGLREAREQARQRYEQTRREVLQRVEGARELRAVDVPPPQEVVKSLGILAGMDKDRTLPRRPLLVEFFTVSEEKLAVFLMPLWKVSPPVVEWIEVKRGAVLQMARSLLKATGRLKPGTRGHHRREERAIPSQERQASRGQFEQLFNEMGALIEPWARHLEEWQPTELLLSPHFLLNLLPLHAATWKGRPLIAQFPMVYLPSPALAQEIVRKRKRLTGEALLLGNPTGDLPGAEQEVNWIAAYLRARGIGYNRFVSEQATTDRVDTHAAEAGLLHSACHSLLERDFLRSGMELADRRLTALDVTATLDLKRAMLVYLSSCDSGQAVAGRTDELMALARVFLYAGIPTVIATLWALNDGAGSTFADHFYKFWIREEQEMAVAFRQAMRETRALHPHPSIGRRLC